LKRVSENLRKFSLSDWQFTYWPDDKTTKCFLSPVSAIGTGIYCPNFLVGTPIPRSLRLITTTVPKILSSRYTSPHSHYWNILQFTLSSYV
jgi:hypothetical protein